MESPEKREASASDSSEDQGLAEIDGTHLDHADSNGNNNGSSGTSSNSSPFAFDRCFDFVLV